MERRIILMVAAAFLAAGVTTSCNKEPVEVDTEGAIGFTVNAEEAVGTKSAGGESMTMQTSETFRVGEGEESLYITATKTINGDSPFGPATKGAELTKNDIGVGTRMIMYKADGDRLAVGTLEASSISTKFWSFKDTAGETVMWPDDSESGGAKYSFLSYVDKAGQLSGFDDGEISYEGPDHKKGSNADADESEDILVAYTEGVSHDHKNQNLVALNFYHPLAAVKFYVNRESGVKRVRISGVKKKGTFKYSAVDPEDKVDFEKAFAWTAGSETADYVQDVDYGGLTSGYAEVEFFLMPQAFEDGMKFTFDVEKEKTGEIYQITTKASVASNIGGSSWGAGYRYNYYLESAKTAERNLGIKVSEEWDATNFIKTDVGVENVMRSTVYVRMAVVGNWVSDMGKIVEAFDFGDAKFNTDSDDSWIEGSDGFYYYRKPLVGYEKTDPLIDEFKDESTLEGLGFNNLGKYHLVWKIVAQGVEYDEAKNFVKAAWGSSGVIDMLETE